MNVMRWIAVTGILLAFSATGCETKGPEAPVDKKAVASAPVKAPVAKPAAKPVVKEEPKPEPAAAQESAPDKGSGVITGFQVEGLDDPAKVKKLAEALVGADGVMSAKADKEAGLFNVTYDSTKLCPGRLMGRLKAVDPGVSVAGTKAADGSGEAHGCGGCPKAESCGKH